MGLSYVRVLFKIMKKNTFKKNNKVFCHGCRKILGLRIQSLALLVKIKAVTFIQGSKFTFRKRLVGIYIFWFWVLEFS